MTDSELTPQHHVTARGNCALCGGLHYGTGSLCVFRCEKCKVRTGPCPDVDCPRDGRWKAEKVEAESRRIPRQRTQEPLQTLVAPWMQACFGSDISLDRRERNHRFIEESLELVQACGMPAVEAHMLVDYVYGRPAGTKEQEVGGVMITLAALCLAHGMNMHDCGDVELVRIWTKIDQIREKQRNKPRDSPLPAAALPKEPSLGLLMSMAIRDDHALGCPGYYDGAPFGKAGITHAKAVAVGLSRMRQLYEEVSGQGFYRPEREAEYAALAGNQEEG